MKTRYDCEQLNEDAHLGRNEDAISGGTKTRYDCEQAEGGTKMRISGVTFESVPDDAIARDSGWGATDKQTCFCQSNRGRDNTALAELDRNVAVADNVPDDSVGSAIAPPSGKGRQSTDERGSYDCTGGMPLQLPLSTTTVPSAWKRWPPSVASGGWRFQFRLPMASERARGEERSHPNLSAKTAGVVEAKTLAMIGVAPDLFPNLVLQFVSGQL